MIDCITNEGRKYVINHTQANFFILEQTWEKRGANGSDFNEVKVQKCINLWNNDVDGCGLATCF